MEQIIITKPNGSLVPMQNKRTATKIKSAKQNMALLAEDVVNINIESPFKQEYGIGDTITVFGRVYKMNRLPKVRKTGNFGFSYDIEFEGVQYDLMRATYDLTIDTTNNQLQDIQSNALIGDLRRFATVLIANANRVMPGKWRLGDCPDTIEDVNLVFGETDNCLSVLQMLCKQFGYEFEIEQSGGVYIIHFRKSGQTFPFTFEYGKGKGLYALDRQNVSSANIITRLKVYGSTKNITNKYRAQRLCLPGKTKGQSFIEKADAVANYGVWEATKYFEDVYPRRTGTITALGDSVLKFVDNSMFDLNAKEADGITTKYLLNGVSAKIHFNTGNLAGYEFDVHEYDHATKTFTIVKLTDERGSIFPNEDSTAFQFGVGDEYKLLDVALPEEYETEAENDLANKGETYYDQNCQPKVQYGLSITDSRDHGVSGRVAICPHFVFVETQAIRDSQPGNPVLARLFPEVTKMSKTPPKKERRFEQIPYVKKTMLIKTLDGFRDPEVIRQQPSPRPARHDPSVKHITQVPLPIAGLDENIEGRTHGLHAFAILIRLAPSGKRGLEKGEKDIGEDLVLQQFLVLRLVKEVRRTDGIFHIFIGDNFHQSPCGMTFLAVKTDRFEKFVFHVIGAPLSCHCDLLAVGRMMIDC